MANLRNHQALEITRVPPIAEYLEKFNRPTAILPTQEAVAITGFTFVVVIPGSALNKIALGHVSQAVNGLHPVVFRGLCGFDGLSIVVHAVLYHMGKVASLLVQAMRHVGGKAGLGKAEKESIGETVAVQAVESSQAVIPFFSQ